MIRVVLRACAVAGGVLCIAGCNTQALTAAEVLSIDSAQGVDPTGNFTVPGRWDLTYAWDCARAQSQGVAGANRFAMTVYNADDKSLAAEHPQVTALSRKGGSTMHFGRSGTYFVQVDSACDWRLSVEDFG
jgi:hypothetical protein